MRFLKDAERSFGNRLPEIAFRTLDIERPFEAQGFAAHTYDLVTASNVMHATADLDGALERVRRLLRTGAGSFVNEVTRIQDFHTVTFGLLDGWWAHEDEGGRLELSPLLDAEMWKGRLAAVGFDRVAVLGKSDDGRELPQRVIVAEAGAATVPAAPAPAVTPEPLITPAPIRRERAAHPVVASEWGECDGECAC